jgi:hypothetical protein
VILRMPPNLLKLNLLSMRTGNPPKNLDPGAVAGAVAVVAEVPEPPANAVAPSDWKKVPKRAASPSRPASGNRRRATARRGLGMQWSNPNGSIGKMNWSQRKSRWAANPREPSGKFLLGPMQLPSSSKEIWKTIAEPRLAADAVLALVHRMGRDRNARRMEVAVVRNRRVRTTDLMIGRQEPPLPETRNQEAPVRDRIPTAMNPYPAPTDLAPMTIAHPKGEDAMIDRVLPADAPPGIRPLPSHPSTEGEK